jgi:hypothetical protein
MSNARLFTRLRSLIEDANNADKKHIRQLRKVLRKLKDRQNALGKSLLETDNLAEKQKIEREIEVLTLQRSKGVEVYKQLKNARKSAKRAKPGD